MEGRRLRLGHLADLAEHLARRCLVEADPEVHLADRLQHPGHAEGRELPGQDRLVPRRRHEALGGEVVHLGRSDGAERLHERGLVQEIALDDLDPVADVGDPLVRRGAGTPRHPHDAISLLEQELGEVGAILAGDPGDEGCLHGDEYRASTFPTPAR